MAGVPKPADAVDAVPPPLSDDEIRALEERFDSEVRFRPLGPVVSLIVGGLLIALSLFHYYTAGFGLLQETTHRGIHLAFVLGLIFLVFGFTRSEHRAPAPSAWWRPGGLPLWDWLIALAAAAAALDDMEFVARSYAENLNGMRQLEEGARRLGRDYIPSYGNFLTIHVGKAAEIFKRLLRRGVIVRPIGGGYGLPEHLRVTIGTAAENDKFLAALAASLRE